MKVLTVGHSYVVAMNRSIVREIGADTNFEVTVCAPSFFMGSLRPVRMEPEPEGSRLRLKGVDTFVSKKIHFFFYHPLQLAKVMDSEKFDLVHIWEEPYILAGFQVAQAAAKRKIPFFFRTAQSIVKDYPFPFSLFEKKVLSWKSGWIAGGNTVFQAMLERGFPQEQGEVITLSVDTKKFKPFSQEEKRRVQSALGLNAPVIGMLGRLTEAKGCDVLMEALEKYGGQRPWSMYFMGSGDYEKKIRDWAVARGWQDRIKVQLLKHDEVPGILPALDLLVAPSQTRPNWREQFGRMLVEAFACAVPVIGSDSGEIPHVIGDAGLVVGETDVAGWTQAIEKGLSDPAWREKTIEIGLERAKYYSSESVAERYKTFYKKVVSRQGS